MKALLKTLILLNLALFQGMATADEALIQQALTKIMPGAKADSVTPAIIPGLYEVMIGPNIFYISKDGKYLVQGKIIDVEARKDLTDAKMARARITALDKIGTNHMIIFKPEESKHTVSIFTDIDCGYCRKLHAEMDQYLAEGITVQYLFFPRAGKGSDSYKKAVSVWCADNRNDAMTRAKKGESIAEKECDNPVDEHMQLGIDFNTRGTPMMITEKGNVLPGYVPAKQLAKALEVERYN